MSVGSVLITGANRGLGLEFVKQFASLSKPPRHIFATCRDPDSAKDLQLLAQDNATITVFKLDIKDYDAFLVIAQQIDEKVGDAGLNLLINNAGIMFGDNLEDVTREHMMENFEVNAVCPLFFTKALLPTLKKAASKLGGNSLSSSRAAVVNITSKMGSIDDNTSGSCYPYRTSKTALNMVTRSLSVDLKPHGILAFALHPGWVLTDMGGSKAPLTPETSVQGMISTILKASDQHVGLMLNYDSKPIPW